MRLRVWRAGMCGCCNLCTSDDTPGGEADVLLTEDGDGLLTEDGDVLALED